MDKEDESYSFLPGRVKHEYTDAGGALSSRSGLEAVPVVGLRSFIAAVAAGLVPDRDAWGAWPAG